MVGSGDWETDPTLLLDTGLRRDRGDREAARRYSRLLGMLIAKHKPCQI